MSFLATLAATGLGKAVGKFFDKNGSSLLSAGLGAISSLFSNNRQYKNQLALQNDAQAFNSREAQLNRDWQTQMQSTNNSFNARQAEIAREWQQQFYEQYQSPGAMMRQYRDAGINPVLAVGANASTPPSASSASSASVPGGAAASSGIGAASPMSLVADIASLMKLKAEIDNIQADTEGKRAGAKLSLSSAELNSTLKDFKSNEINKLKEEVNYIKEQAKTEVQKRAALAASAALDMIQKENIDYELAMSRAIEDKFGKKLAPSTINAIITGAGGLITQLLEIYFGNKLKQKSLNLPDVEFGGATGNVNF